MLACTITSSTAIEGVTQPGDGRVFKGDTSIAATTDASITATFDVYVEYELASRVKLNRGKSSGLWLGAWKDQQNTPHTVSSG